MTKPSYRVILDDERFSSEMKKREWTTNAAVAEALDISEPTIWKLRSGTVSPSALTIDRLLSGLGLEFTDLFIREEQP